MMSSTPPADETRGRVNRPLYPGSAALLTQVIGAVLLAMARTRLGKDQRCQLLQGPLVDAPLEIDDIAHRLPVLHPAPVVELRLVTAVETKVAFVALHAQEKPALFLPDAQRLGVAADELLGQAVAEPVARAAEELHLVGPETHLLLQLAVHRLFRRLSLLDASLGKLPGVLANAPPPEETLVAIDQYDAHVWPESIPVDHGIVLVLYL